MLRFLRGEERIDKVRRIGYPTAQVGDFMQSNMVALSGNHIHRWFGIPWSATCTPESRVERPSGHCHLCGQMFSVGSRGLLLPNDFVPVHLECYMRAA